MYNLLAYTELGSAVVMDYLWGLAPRSIIATWWCKRVTPASTGHERKQGKGRPEGGGQKGLVLRGGVGGVDRSRRQWRKTALMRRVQEDLSLQVSLPNSPLPRCYLADTTHLKVRGPHSRLALKVSLKILNSLHGEHGYCRSLTILPLLSIPKDNSGFSSCSRILHLTLANWPPNCLAHGFGS